MLQSTQIPPGVDFIIDISTLAFHNFPWAVIDHTYMPKHTHTHTPSRVQNVTAFRHLLQTPNGRQTALVPCFMTRTERVCRGMVAIYIVSPFRSVVCAARCAVESCQAAKRSPAHII